MNYEALQLLIKSLLANFKCDSCGSGITTQDINLLSIDGKKLTLDVNCKSCKKVSLIKSEVVAMDLGKMNLSSNQIMMIKNGIDKRNTRRQTSKSSINDQHIIELDKDLKKEKLSVDDLLN